MPTPGLRAWKSCSVSIVALAPISQGLVDVIGIQRDAFGQHDIGGSIVVYRLGPRSRVSILSVFVLIARIAWTHVDR